MKMKGKEIAELLQLIARLTVEKRYCKGKGIFDEEVIKVGMCFSSIDFNPEDRTPYYKRIESINKSNELEHFKRKRINDINNLLLNMDKKEYMTLSFMLFKLFCDDAKIRYYNDKNLLTVLTACYMENKEKKLTINDLYEKDKIYG